MLGLGLKGLVGIEGCSMPERRVFRAHVEVQSWELHAKPLAAELQALPAAQNLVRGTCRGTLVGVLTGNLQRALNRKLGCTSRHTAQSKPSTLNP